MKIIEVLSVSAIAVRVRPGHYLVSALIKPQSVQQAGPMHHLHIVNSIKVL